MAALTTVTTIKGDGLKFNVRSYKFERVLDFTKLDLTASTYFEIGDLPTGFIPRAIGVLELKKQDTAGGASAATFGVYLKADSQKLAERVLGTAAGETLALLTKATTTAAGSPLEYTTVLAPKFQGGTLAVHVNNKPVTGLVKIVISGDMMSDLWDEGLKRDSFDPAEHIQDPALN